MHDQRLKILQTLYEVVTSCVTKYYRTRNNREKCDATIHQQDMYLMTLPSKICVILSNKHSRKQNVMTLTYEHTLNNKPN